LKVLLVTTELAPFATASGLANTVRILSKELLKLRHAVRVAIPCYPMVEYDARYNVRPVLDNIMIPWPGSKAKHAFVKTAVLEDVLVYLVGGPEYFRDVFDSNDICREDWESHAFFARAVLETLKAVRPRWTPRVIHVNSWRSDLVPVYLDALHDRRSNLRNVAVVATVHNIIHNELEHLAASGAIYGVGQVEYGKGVSILRTARDYESLYKAAWRVARSSRQQEIRIADRIRLWPNAA